MTKAQWKRKPGDLTWTRSGWRDKAEDLEGWETSAPGERAIDVTGREVFVGDRLAVAVTVGRSANMRVGKVVSIEDIMEDDWSNYNDTRPTKKPSGRVRIKCEWEASTWNEDVKASGIQADLPKYLKLS